MDKENIDFEKLFKLNQNLHYLQTKAQAKREFAKFSSEGEVFKQLETEFLSKSKEKPDFYSIQDFEIVEDIKEELKSQFVFAFYELAPEEVSIEISDIYGICAGDNGETVSLITGGNSGLIAYLESHGFKEYGFSETTLIFETENYLELNEKIKSFGLIPYKAKSYPKVDLINDPINIEKIKKPSIK